ncbi:winged helix-turn-helix transcriptional regulator [Candidatus Microgenomates bacterium]|nr:winged helix-turn-helix transcriptional regulator [Candidatus Microgenomates bacterium]
MSEGDPLPVPPQEATSQQERLSDKQMGGLLSAVGTNEAKAILLILMRPNTTYTAWALHQLIMRGQGQHPGWEINHSVPYQYCEESFVNNDLVGKKVEIRRNLPVTDYIKTPYGENEGAILAGLLANYSSTHPDVSLHQLFASLKSGSKREHPQDRKRALATRLKIFWELTTASLPLRQWDLADAIHEDPGIVERHLQQLRRMGVIEYETVNTGEPVTYYKLSPNHPPDQPSSYKAQPSLTQFVYQTLIGSPDREWSLTELAQLYLQQTTRVNRQHSSKEVYEKNLKYKIDYICSSLMQNGYAERGKFSVNDRSAINLSPKQRQNLVDLVTLLDAFQRQDPEILAEGRTLVQYFRDHPREIAELMAKARKNSPEANQQPLEETAKSINEILTEHPGLTIRELQELINLHTSTIGLILQRFKFPFIVEKNVKHFSSHPNSSKPVFEQEQDAA